MNIPGIQINVEAISKGLWEMIKEQGDDHIVSAGMIPAVVMKLLRKNLDRKIPDKYFVEGNPLEDIDGTRIKNEIEREVAAQILSHANAEGVLRV